MRLIDADALIKATQNFCDDYKVNWTDNKVLSWIDHAPTIDAVPVVRCKDCVHWYDREEVCLKIYSDGNVSADAWQDRKPDDFCSYGERKGGEDNV